MEPAVTLANTPLDLLITICIFSHPSDILALRKTCKALEFATRKRIVWMTVLHRVCLDNTLFLPSFPIPDMSDLELERAAMAPRRWIELCGSFREKNSSDFSEMLYPRTTRIIEDTARASSLYIVPGGRYLVSAGSGLFVWDLGYGSVVDCKLVASVGLEDQFGLCMIQTTPDGKGLVILSSNTQAYSIFEIYPQSETPLLTQIARFVFTIPGDPVHLLPDTLILRVFYDDRVVFRVVDYRKNYSAHFSADVDMGKIVQTFATKTAIIVFCKEGILIWAIPPLPSDLPFRRLFDNNVPPLFKIPFPDHTHENFKWMTASSWYFGSESVYFDILYTNSKLQRFKIIMPPDLSDASLHVINIAEDIFPDDFILSDSGYHGICEDALVYLWNNRFLDLWGAYTGLSSAPFTNVVTRWKGYDAQHPVDLYTVPIPVTMMGELGEME